MERTKLVELKGITKTFGGVFALDNVDFKVYEGEIVALVGDNGAGKSTLIKVISGVYIPDAGEIYFENNKVDIKNPIDAMRLEIETIYQDLALFDDLTASANLFMGRELYHPVIGKAIRFLNQKGMNRETTKTLAKIGIGIANPRTKVKKFSGGQRQGIAIGRSILWGKKLVIMDEPTAALGVQESEKFLSLIKSLISIVKGIIVISHNIEHVIGIANRAVVLRRGKRVGELEIKIKSSRDSDRIHHDLVAMITGKTYKG